MIINPDVLSGKIDDDMNLMKETDKKYLDENDKFLLWNTYQMASMIGISMENELNSFYQTTWNTMWYSLRLKFTDEIIQKEALEYLNGHVDYTKEIYGHKIYDIMKEYECAYPMALLKIYAIKNNWNDGKYVLEREVLDFNNYPVKIRNSKLQEDGTIEYLPHVPDHITQEEWNKDYEELKRKQKERIKNRHRGDNNAN